MCPHESPGRLLESVSDYRSRWMVILDRIRLIGRLFFNISERGLNPRSLSHIFLVQVFTQPVADLEVFMGKRWANMGSLMGSLMGGLLAEPLVD